MNAENEIEALSIFDGYALVQGHAAVLAVRGEQTALFICPGKGHYRHCFQRAIKLAEVAGFTPISVDLPDCIPV